jgi:hypothetical protein
MNEELQSSIAGAGRGTLARLCPIESVAPGGAEVPQTARDFDFYASHAYECYRRDEPREDPSRPQWGRPGGRRDPSHPKPKGNHAAVPVRTASYGSGGRGGDRQQNVAKGKSNTLSADATSSSSSLLRDSEFDPFEPVVIEVSADESEEEKSKHRAR